MKVFRQFGIILLFSFLGEACNYLIPLPIPASIYGLVLILLALILGLLKLEHIKEAAGFFIEIMPLMFIPSAVGILNSWNAIAAIWLPIVFIIIVSTFMVMVVTGRVTQFIIRKEKKK